MHYSRQKEIDRATEKYHFSWRFRCYLEPKYRGQVVQKREKPGHTDRFLMASLEAI